MNEHLIGRYLKVLKSLNGWENIINPKIGSYLKIENITKDNKMVYVTELSYSPIYITRFMKDRELELMPIGFNINNKITCEIY